jgi:hypothetical protein
MKRAYIVLPILLIALVGMSCLAIAATPNLDKDDETSTPHGYAEAVVTGSWSLWGHPYYQTRHQAKTNPSSLNGTAVFTGWNKSGGVVYNVTVNFVGSYSYDAPYYNVAWAAQTVCIAGGETAVAVIGPPGSQ